MKETGITENPRERPPASTSAIAAGEPPPRVLLVEESRSERPGRAPKNPLWRGLEVVASLRITVTLFVLFFLLVFWGTWAQRDQGIWTVVEQYFRSLYVFVPLRVLSCNLLDSSLAIPFPGGWLLGGAMLVNLLAAHIVRFKFTWKRSGILVLHAGLIVLMLGEFFTGKYAVEGMMTIVEGGSSNFIEHDRYPELAVIDSSDPKMDDVVVVPGTMLRSESTVTHPDLPFDIEVVDYMANSALLEKVDPKGNNPATIGYGLDTQAVARPEVSGADPDQRIDAPSAYLTFKDKETGKALGTWLVSYWLRHEQPVQVGEKTYQVSLRFKRTYRPYSIHLLDFQHKKFVGTNTPKDFSSIVRLEDPTTGEKREVRIWMNHPLRYGGETFYQASFLPGDRGTVLQVVRNPAALFPYIACILVSCGMLAHFIISLVGFLAKRGTVR